VKKIIFFISVFIFISSCSSNDDDDENEVDCSVVNCQPGAPLSFIFFRNNQNEIGGEDNEVIISQNGYVLDTGNIGRQINFFVDNSPFVINIGEEEIIVEPTVFSIEDPCCSVIKVESLIINGVEMCTDEESCNEVIEFNI